MLAFPLHSGGVNYLPKQLFPVVPLTIGIDLTPISTFVKWLPRPPEMVKIMRQPATPALQQSSTEESKQQRLFPAWSESSRVHSRN